MVPFRETRSPSVQQPDSSGDEPAKRAGRMRDERDSGRGGHERENERDESEKEQLLP